MLADGTLAFIALADDDAGMFDDLVIADTKVVTAHQYKSSISPSPIGATALLLGTNQIIGDCAASYISLRRRYPKHAIKLRYVTSDFPSASDSRLLNLNNKASSDLFEAIQVYKDRSLENWRASEWASIIEQLFESSGLIESDFEEFLNAIEFVFRAPSSLEVNEEINPYVREEIKHIGSTLHQIIGVDKKTQWSHAELLDALGWKDVFTNRFEHRFPLGQHVQRNEVTEGKIQDALAKHQQGYLSLVGPPGAGKSTLLERSVFTGPFKKVVRYLAYVPGTAQGLGRGEAIHFLSDINSQLRLSGLPERSAKNGDLVQVQEQFGRLLLLAGERYARSGVTTTIIVDGLDHVPREEKPEHSFLHVLPLPQALPKGVTILLGSQRVDIAAIPPQVRQQASEHSRQVAMAPLSGLAISEMIRTMGLRSHVTTAQVASISQGHPLVCHYLLARLQGTSPDERDAVLNGDFVYDGDIDALYQSVWSGATEGENTINGVLRVLGSVEGPIEPALLAEYLGDDAVEATFEAAVHLLDRRNGCWTPFHNSFRLFLQRQTVTKYGQPNPDFSSKMIYARLAELTSRAPADSTQRWLKFRYTLLSGNTSGAAQIASRSYFMAQFVSGRGHLDIARDIDSAFGCYGSKIEPENLFDLLLAKDELYRRTDAISTSSNLVDAQIAAGELGLAQAQLESDHTQGDVYKVVHALLADGQIDSARQLFDHEQPWDSADTVRNPSWQSLYDWATYAVIFLDEEQISQRLNIRPEQAKDEPLPLGVTPAAEIDAAIRLALAYSRIDKDASYRVSETIDELNLSDKERARLLLHSAEANIKDQNASLALARLTEFRDLVREGALPGPSWMLSACRTALDLGAYDVADEMFNIMPKVSLADLMHQSERVAGRVHDVLGYSAVAARLGKENTDLPMPDQEVYKVMQAHACAIGRLLGEQANGALTADGTEIRSIDAALRFIGRRYGTYSEDGHEVFGSHWGDKRLFDAVSKLVEQTPHLATDFEQSVKSHILSKGGRLSNSLHFHLAFTDTLYSIDGDKASANRRLEKARPIIALASSPHEEIDQLAELAIAYGKIGAKEKARLILSEMRTVSLGIYAAAKKDGQYQLWSELLIAANLDDPAGAASRSVEVLRLLVGVYESEGSDQATRAGKEVLVQALSAAGGAHAASVFQWVYEHGFFDWADLVDAECRALLRQAPELVGPITTAWVSLCLPYYGEVYNSLTDTGMFIKELMALQSPSIKDAAVDSVLSALQRDAKPEARIGLLRTLRDAALANDMDAMSISYALDIWEQEPLFEDAASSFSESLPDYTDISDFEAVSAAVDADVSRREAHSSTSYGNLVNGTLANQIARVVTTSQWDEVKAFANSNPELVKITAIRRAIAKIAMDAGEKLYAEDLLLPAPEDRDGWGGWYGRGSIEYHQGRHLLGYSDAYTEARTDFVSALALGGRGAGSALWDFHTILHVLYPKDHLDFGSIWRPLGVQIPHFRDYRNQTSIPMNTADDCTEYDRLIRLFTLAARFEISDLREQLRNAASELLHHGWFATFADLCKELLQEGSEAAVLAARCMLDAMDIEALSDLLRYELQSMSEGEDAVVVAAAQILGRRWGESIDVERPGLPFAYSLEHAPLSTTRDRSLIHPRTRSPLTDDPATWTIPWLRDFESLSEISGLPLDTLRHRAYHLMKTWGGLDRFGANATQALEDEYSRLGLRLTYINPHAGVLLRAIRAVINEVWRAGYLSVRDADFLLSRIDGGPLQPPWQQAERRPFDQSWPSLPSNSYSSENQNWLEETSFKRNEISSHVLAYLSSFDIFKGRDHSREDTMMWRGNWVPSMEESFAMPSLIETLPHYALLQGHMMAVNRSPDQDTLSCRLTTSLSGGRTTLLIFDPAFAEQLDWSTRNGNPLTYYDAVGEIMIRTQIWRDGWPQPMLYGDRHWASGQALVLSEKGRTTLSNVNAFSEQKTLRLRQCEKQDKDIQRATWKSWI